MIKHCGRVIWRVGVMLLLFAIWLQLGGLRSTAEWAESVARSLEPGQKEEPMPGTGGILDAYQAENEAAMRWITPAPAAASK